MDAAHSRYTANAETEGHNVIETKKAVSRRGGPKATAQNAVALFDSPENKRMLSALTRGEDLPNDEEDNLTSALRELRREEARPLTVRPELLEHGYVTPAKAARLLGVSRKSIEARTSAPPSAYVTGGHLTLVGPGIPLSELLRSIIADRQQRLYELAKKVVGSVTFDGMGVGRWSLSRHHLDDIRERASFLNVDQAAKELGISKAAVVRATKDEGPDSLFAQQVKHRAGWCYSPEEIAAYKRKLERGSLLARTLRVRNPRSVPGPVPYCAAGGAR
ncbi:MAG: hypothetical protein IPJ65_07220 [Archangiaceae bacterium]|nr:hypothetical protein [Archangiaceae bacterium]